MKPASRFALPWQHALAMLGGLLVATGIPPIGWWPLVVLGVACYIVASERAGRRPRTQFLIALLFAWSWLAPAMGWMWHLVPGGFVIAPLLFAIFHGAAAATTTALVPRSDSSLTARIVLRVALHSLVECARLVVPFGGVPLAGLALGVADTPLAYLARLVGPIGVSFWLMLVGGVLAALFLQYDAKKTSGAVVRTNGRLVSLALVLMLVQLIAQFLPNGRETGETLRIAAVQGGGPQGVLAINTDPRDVTRRHLEATALVTTQDRVDLVIWPENTIDVRDFSTSKVRNEIASEARRIGAPIAVGVTEDVGDNFTNAQIVVDAAGNELSRYDKVRRVPYGEYIPLRSLLDALGAPVDRIPRDAVAGTAPARIEVPGPGETTTHPLAVAISWEVFFSARVNDGIAAGGQLVINPTNGSSYTGEILQQQQVATSQLRAIESGRFLVQAATTGYSLVIDPNGNVLRSLSIGEKGALVETVALRSGRTAYSYLGDVSVATGLAIIALLAVRRGRK